MGLFNMFSLQKISTNDTLCILEEYQKFPIGVVKDILDFYVKILEQDPSRYLMITGSLNNRIIPILDCDSVGERNQTIQHLDKREVRRAVFQSSKKEHYWVIPDMSFGTFEAAWRAICYIPGNDHKYLKFTKERGYFCIRGECKEVNDSPKLISSNCVEPSIAKFIELVTKHFSDYRLQTIASVKVKRLLETEKKKSEPLPMKESWY